MLRFLWRGSHLGECSSASLYKTVLIKRGPWNCFRSQERRRAPINTLYNPFLRRLTERSTGENICCFLLSHRILFSCAVLKSLSLLLSFFLVFQKLKQWKLLTLWLESCSSSLSKAAGRCLTRTQTETPCKIDSQLCSIHVGLKPSSQQESFLCED